jgi:anti-sigma factor RsiW
MNTKRLTPQNVSQDFVLERLSDYVEGNLSPSEQEAVAQYLERDTPESKAAAQEANDLARMLTVLHSRVPRREPTLDIWQEFNPKMQHYLQEEKMSVADRVKLRAGRFLSNVAAGTILFTHAVAVNTESKMKKYLVEDPFEGEETA